MIVDVTKQQAAADAAFDGEVAELQGRKADVDAAEGLGRESRGGSLCMVRFDMLVGLGSRGDPLRATPVFKKVLQAT